LLDADVAVQRFDRMQVARSGSRGGQRGCNLLGDDATFADPADHHSAALRQQVHRLLESLVESLGRGEHGFPFKAHRPATVGDRGAHASAPM